MYKRRAGQISMLETPEMFGSLPLNPENEWVKLGKIIPWGEFEERYAKNFKSRNGQPACSARMALGALLIKERNGFSDEDVVKHLAMNPYFQYFIGLSEYRYEAPFDASMLTRFRKRITPEMLMWVNDRVIGRPEEKPPEDQNDNHNKTCGGSGGDESKTETANAPSVEESHGTLILDATCAPQAIRFPTDTSLLHEARENAEEIIDLLHAAGLTNGKKPRTYREKARKAYNAFSKCRKKTKKTIRKAIRAQLQYLGRDLRSISDIVQAHPDCLHRVLPERKLKRLAVIVALYKQQREMYDARTHRIENRIVSLSQYWVRPIMRGKQNAEVEFGSKVEMSVVDGYLRVEEIRWNAFNESTTLIQSVEAYRRSYGHYPKRVLADTIFRTRDNLRFCKERGIHINGPRLGRRNEDESVYRQERRQEWLESGERGEIERDFGVGKRRYSLGHIMMKLKHTSEVAVCAVVLTMNLWRKLRLLFCYIGSTSVDTIWMMIGVKFRSICLSA